MITRRKLIVALGAGALAAPLACFAQQQRSKVARIGLLESSSASSSANLHEALIAGLRELGLVEGKNIIIEYRWADGKYERLPGLAAELVQMKVDVILAGGTPAVQAAKQATTSIPIVMVRAGDPVGSGFVESLSRPGRNITGLSNIIVEVASKYVELLRAAVPKLSRVTVLVNPTNPIHPDYFKRVQATEKTNSVTISPIQASTASQIEAAFGAMKHERAGALIVLGDPFFSSQARRIAELAARQRLPTMFWTREAVESGGLMSYGQNLAEQFYRAATYVDKILKGAKAADLPVEQPTKIELVINLKTAKAIGLTIPQELLFRADKVIE
ncbi:MAG TPA: ABC transporter substrate-binding protein [Burkholderiales bacterium]|nr:ABC transporter substrate-binding protein [Burkholderiales bacterium]